MLGQLYQETLWKIESTAEGSSYQHQSRPSKTQVDPQELQEVLCDLGMPSLDGVEGNSH